MKLKLLIFFSFSLLFFRCSDPKSDVKNSDESLMAKGNKIYGGSLRVAESDPVQTLNPSSITDAASAFIATQIYDGLVKYNTSNLKIEPAIAEKWEIDASGTKYTFILRKGVLFHEDDCYPDKKTREVKANDFKYAFEQLCTAGPNNETFVSTFKDRVLGANEFYEKVKGDNKTQLTGVKVINDYTLEINLLRPSSVFLGILAEPACAVYSMEAQKKYGNKLRNGAGAFIYDEKSSTKERVVLLKNKNYYRKDELGNQLPFLDSVVVSVIQTKEQELTLFKEGKLDLIMSLPSLAVKEMVESQIKDFQSKPPKYLLDQSPEMITQYYTFNTKRAPFDNPKVRRAFCLAINRQKIVDNVLNGQAYGPGTKGITPPTFSNLGYDINEINGYDYNPEEARKLLAQAGFENGKGFPEIKVILNSGGLKNTNVVVEIQKQILDNLNINVDFDVVPYKQKLEAAQYGTSYIIRDAWVADYPSPETFLNLFYGAIVPKDASAPSFPNTSRFQNKDYDKYFVLGRDAKNLDSSNFYFKKAEQVLMNEAPIMVLWYEGNYRITYFYVKNAPTNAMRYRNLSEVYIKKSDEKSTNKAAEEEKK